MNSENETRKHITLVSNYLSLFAIELLNRARDHDKSKLEEPEKSIFEQFTPLLENCTFGSPEYKSFLERMKPAIDHHHSVNKHHPEFNVINGYHYQTLNDPIKSMDLIDVVEMICDWLAASKRHTDGCIGKSITICTEKYHLDHQLEMLLRNTAAIIEYKSKI